MSAMARYLTIVMLWLCLPFGGLVAAEGGDLSEAAAINKAGRQRMLTQRILLTYSESGLGVMPAVADQRRSAAIALFDEQLRELEAYAPTPEVSDALARLDRLWQPFKAIAAAPPTRAGAQQLLYWNDDLLYLAHKVVQLLQDVSGTTFARLVNVSGRQRMLSQRLAKFYMLGEWGFDTLTIRDELEQARNEFAGALAALEAAPENSDAIREQLDAVALQWAWFENALDLRGEQPYRLVVSDSAEAILRKMDEITQLYEQLVER